MQNNTRNYPPGISHPRSPLKSHHTIIHGDSRQMNLLADRSVHLVVTSPPYWQLKDYGTENQIGFHESYESSYPHAVPNCLNILKSFSNKNLILQGLCPQLRRTLGWTMPPPMISSQPDFLQTLHPLPPQR